MADLSGGNRIFKPTADQRAAIHRLDGRLFIAAGAGSGKTAVVANRFVEAIARGEAAVDEILTITFTRKAAAEMMHRIRSVLRQNIQQDPDAQRVERMSVAYRDIERARISTIDSFYSGLLRSHALAAGIDPDFTAADAPQATLIRQRCFDRCLEQFVEEYGDTAADLITAYDPGLSGRLFNTISGVYDELRSRGHEPAIPFPDVERMIDTAGKRMSEAIDEFEAAVKRESASNKTVDAILEGNQRLREALATTDPERRLELVAGSRPGGRAGKVNTERQMLKQAWADYLDAVRSPLAVSTLLLFNFLLNRFHEIYAAEKYEQGILDFADLSLFTRDLLQGNAGVRHSQAARLKLIMVDEFQDTNPLQHEIVQALERGNLMMVGDENQSIYGFRDAEVGLFRQEKAEAEAAGCCISLLENFRSQREILAFVDSLFGCDEMLRPGYLQLDSRADVHVNPHDYRVEVIMVDEKPPGREKKLSAEECRQAEAQLIAERLRELYDGGGYAPRDTALLVANRTGIELYRDALERMGIKTYLAIGIGYYGQQELGDAINLLRLLVNPLDDEALTGVLRSPMVLVSDDALFWLRQMAGRDDDGSRKPLWRVLSAEQTLKRVPAADRLKLQQFVIDVNAMREAASREPLAETARRVIGYADYRAATGMGKNGKQAVANLMKLIDLAVDYESVWGRKLADFTEFLLSSKSESIREAEPPIEEEGVDAVRIMTMHTAKGLEFPLVVLPKLAGGNGGGRDKPQILIDRDRSSGRVGLNFRSVRDDDYETFHYGQLKQEKAARDREEEKRLLYVAMTRAERHLILVGSAPADEKPRQGEKARPFDWIRALLGLDRKSRPELDELRIIEAPSGIPVGIDLHTDADEALLRAATAQSLDRFEAPLPVSEEITAPPAAASFVPAMISPTGLDTFSSCERRYYLENVVHIRDLFDVKWAGAMAAEGGNLSATDMGTLVHALLETDLGAAMAGSISAELLDEKAAEVLGKDASLTGADASRALHLLGNLKAASVADDLFRAWQSGRLETELSFSTLAGQTILKGKIDALAPPEDADEATLVVDYKTGSPGNGRTAEQAAGAYRWQMAAYALAAWRMYHQPVRVTLLFLGGEGPQEFSRSFAAGDIPALESDLQSLIGRMDAGSFPPLGDFDEHLCTWCAGGLPSIRLCPTGARRRSSSV